MEVYAWVTLYDSLYYAPPTEFFQRHPEYTWVSKDGAKRVPGVPCYAYPEVRRYRIDQVKELVAYDVDGIFLSDRSHSPWPGRNAGGGNEGARGYGFNEPVVAEYLRRYGKDPRTVEPDSLDELRFVQLKGDFLTEFLREAKAVTSAAGKKLVMTTDQRIADPTRATWMYVDAETLARERILDELCIRSAANASLDHWRLLADGRIKMTTWAGHPRPNLRTVPGADAFSELSGCSKTRQRRQHVSRAGQPDLSRLLGGGDCRYGSPVAGEPLTRIPASPRWLRGSGPVGGGDNLARLPRRTVCRRLAAGQMPRRCPG